MVGTVSSGREVGGGLKHKLTVVPFGVISCFLRPRGRRRIETCWRSSGVTARAVSSGREVGGGLKRAVGLLDALELVVSSGREVGGGLKLLPWFR